MDRFLREKLVLESERQEEEFNSVDDDLGVIDTGDFNEGDAFDLGESDDSDFLSDGDDIGSFGAAGDRSGVKGDVAWKKDKWYLTFLLAPFYMTKYIFVDMTEDFPRGEEWKGIVKALNTINIICIITALLALAVGLQTIFTPITQIVVGLVLFTITTIITKFVFKEDTKTISIFKRILGIGEEEKEESSEEEDDLLNFDFGNTEDNDIDTGFEFGSIEDISQGVEEEEEFIERDVEIEDKYELEDSPITIDNDEEYNQLLLEVFADNSKYVGRNIRTRLDMVKSFSKYLIQNDKSFGRWKRPKERGVEFNNIAYAMYKCICRIDNAFSSYTPSNEDEDIDRLIIRDIRKSPLLYRIEMELPDRIRLKKFQSNLAEIEDMLRKTEDDVNVNVLVSTFQGSIVLKLLRLDNVQMVSLGDILRFTDEDRGNMGMQGFEDEGKGLPILIGLKNNEYPYVIDFEENSNGVIVGGSGSGKSWTTFEMMLNIITTNDYNNVNFIVLDGKNAPFWGGFARLPHVLGFHYKTDDFIEVLREVEEERQARQEKLKKLGEEDVKGYRKKLREQGRYEELKEMPLLIVVIDEITATMQEMKEEDEDLYKELQSILIQISTRGRSAGVRLLLIGQRSINESIPKSVMGNSSFKFGMKMDVASDFERMFDSDAKNLKKPDTKGMGLLKTEEVGRIQTIKSLTLGGKDSSQIISLIRMLGFEWLRRSVGNGDDVEKQPSIYNFNVAYNRNMIYHYAKQELKEGRLLNEVDVSKGYELDLDKLKEKFNGGSKYDYSGMFGEDEEEDVEYEEIEEDETEESERGEVGTPLVEDDEPLFTKKSKRVEESEFEQFEEEESELEKNEQEEDEEDTFSWKDLQQQIFNEDEDEVDIEEVDEIGLEDEMGESNYYEDMEETQEDGNETIEGIEIEESKKYEEVENDGTETQIGNETDESKEEAIVQNEGGLSIEDLLKQNESQENESEEIRKDEGTLSEEERNKSEEWSEQLGKTVENSENMVKNTENVGEQKRNRKEVKEPTVEKEKDVKEAKEKTKQSEGMELNFKTNNTTLAEPKRSVKSYVIEYGTLKGFNAYITKAELETVYTKVKIEESLDRMLIVEKGNYYIAKM